MAKPYTDHLFDSLPAAYRREGKTSFLYRMLSIFGEVLAGVEEKVDGIHNHISPMRAPAAFLPWLASWVALVLDETWPVAKRREHIAKAVELYKWRGTVRGIKTFVEIYAGMVPDIIEDFRSGWQVGVRSTVGVDTKIYEYGEDVHSFSVVVHSPAELAPEEKQKVMGIVETEKPAHTKVTHYGWHVNDGG
ncbi:MAG: phage tail protein I [Planctomycetota bacterium]